MASVSNLFCVRSGQVTRLILYFDCERALADLGPNHEADSRPGLRG